MPAAPLPPNETERLNALASLDILDTAPEEVYDSFVRVACDLVGAPIGAVSLVAEDRQWFKSIQGLPGVTETTRDASFCAHLLPEPGSVLVVRDATLDARFADNPLVTGEPGIRFYAGTPVFDAGGMPLGALCVIDRAPREIAPEVALRLRDLATGVSAALRPHRCARELAAAAHRDALTGLGNRRAFDAALEEPAGAEGSSLLLFDLDRFKQINDTFGHPAGDAALREVSRRLRGAARRADRWFRLGGDEFALLLPGRLDRQEAASLGGRIHALLSDTFSVNGTAIPLRASIGIAATPPGQVGSFASLVAPADAALYEAKRAGRGRTQVHAHPPPEPSAPRRGPRMDMESRLRRALLSPIGLDLSLNFQPVVDLGRRAVVGVEALARWMPEPGAAVSPAEFVPLAERSGLAVPLDRWALRTACRAAATWPRHWEVCVNVSAITFGLAAVQDLVQEALDDSGLHPRRLMVEMTETALSADESRTHASVSALHGVGVRVALDDFGGGHASLAMLRRYPFAAIKIDRALVSGADRDPVARRTLGFLGELEAMLDRPMVAEGVESAAELAVVRSCGIRRAQGYLLARPVSGDHLAAAAAAAEQTARR